MRHDDDRPRSPAKDRILDAADDVFYAHGINATGVDALIATADVARMTFYRHFSSKDDLVAAYLERRDARWRVTLEEAIARATDARSRLLAVFDALATWHAGERFRGCAFVNAAAELPERDHPARTTVERHKRSLRDRMAELAEDTGHQQPDLLVDQLMMLFDGANATQGLGTVTEAAEKARAAAGQLIPGG